MKRFIFSCFVFSIPFIIILFFYIFTDPFKVIFNYDNYMSYRLNTSRMDDSTKYCVTSNRSYIGIHTFDNKNKTLKYDSFIFGNSRSGFFQINDWKKYIGNNASCIHLGGFNESLYMVNKKLQYVNRKAKIKHVIIPISKAMLLQVDEPREHLTITPPSLTGYKNLWVFHSKFVNTFLSNDFFKYFLECFFTHRLKKNIEYEAFDHIQYTYDSNTCQVGEVGKDVSSLYFPDISNVDTLQWRAENVGSSHYEKIIFDKQKILLEEISNTLESCSCDYHIIIDPLYDKMTFCHEDIEYLKLLFGQHLHDYSGTNNMTVKASNYLDSGHYSSSVAASILDDIYGCKK